MCFVKSVGVGVIFLHLLKCKKECKLIVAYIEKKYMSIDVHVFQFSICFKFTIMNKHIHAYKLKLTCQDGLR